MGSATAKTRSVMAIARVSEFCVTAMSHQLKYSVPPGSPYNSIEMPEIGAMRKRNQPPFSSCPHDTPHSGARIRVSASDTAAETQSMEANSGVTQINIKKMRLSGLAPRKRLGTVNLHSVIPQGLDK